MLLNKNVKKTISEANSRVFLEMIFYSRNADKIIKDIKKTMSILEFISIVELMYLEEKLWNKRSASLIYDKVKKVMKLYEAPHYEELRDDTEFTGSRGNIGFELEGSNSLTPGERAFCLAIAMGSSTDLFLRNLYKYSKIVEDNPTHLSDSQFDKYKESFIYELKNKFCKLGLTDYLFD